MTELVRSDVERAVPAETPAAAQAAAGMRAFGHRLLSEHPELLKGANGVVSAASIATAFAMLRAGASGETADQIDRVFDFPSSDLGAAYNFLTDQWRPSEAKNAPELTVADTLFVQDGFEVKRPFLDALARDFGTGVRSVDFRGDAAEVINAWVREQTRDRIQKLFDQLSDDTHLVIANAIYLKATWVHKFPAHATRDDEFHRSDRGSVRVPFMHQTATFEYAEGAGWSAVRLPYRGDELSMWVLLPDRSGDPIRLLDSAVLDAAATSATSREVELTLPKWDFQSDVPLTNVLPAMGMPRAFTDAAELPGVSTDPPLKVDQVMHRANIIVDEEGTEAAAATGVTMVPQSAVVHRDVVAFVADHPFAFVVLHDATGSPLFEGVVGDPSVPA